MKVVFVHLDLGIGGAEMLVVNSAVAAKRSGHSVLVYTSHHDQRRCFRETKGGGVLAGDIRVRGDWLPRHLAFGRFTAFCAVLRMTWISLCVLWTETRLERSKGGIVIFCDGVSAPVPLLRLVGEVLFYCHFPDKLLCVERGSLLKRIYRWPLDMMEELTTGCASSVAVNSNFTAGIFRETFPRVGKRFPPAAAQGSPSQQEGGVDARRKQRLRVLYPPTDVKAYVERGPADMPPSGTVGPLVSLNRFERKKNLPLALKALAWAVRDMGASVASSKGLRLVVAGGYDERVAENVEHLEELKQRARELGLEDLVDFRLNVADEERSSLLRQALCVLYTPSQEHFGIVPVEAMCSGAPVVAVDSGELQVYY
ncbi:unnamed protein product [Ascophyllum nodosum]